MELEMRRYKLTVYTGPVNVEPVARKFREAGYKVTHTGTEHVFAIAETTESRESMVCVDVLMHLKGFHSTDFGVTVGATRIS